MIAIQYWPKVCIFLFADCSYTWLRKPQNTPDLLGKGDHWILSSYKHNYVELINTSAMISLTCTLSINAENVTYSNRQWVHKPSVCIRMGWLSFSQCWLGKFSQPQRLKKEEFKFWGWNVYRKQFWQSRYKGFFFFFLHLSWQKCHRQLLLQPQLFAQRLCNWMELSTPCY